MRGIQPHPRRYGRSGIITERCPQRRFGRRHSCNISRYHQGRVICDVCSAGERPQLYRPSGATCYDHPYIGAGGLANTSGRKQKGWGRSPFLGAPAPDATGLDLPSGMGGIRAADFAGCAVATSNYTGLSSTLPGVGGWPLHWYRD